jgi:hypothetical protein
MHDLLETRPSAGPVWVVALLALVAVTWTAAPATAVHESHHGPFMGTTSQDERFFMRVLSHTRVGIRFRWRATCESGRVSRVVRFRNVRVGREGRFFSRNGRGVGVRGKIGFDPQGNPAFPEPFSFANNEAKGRARAVFDDPAKGRCTSGTIAWDARR